MSFVLTKKKSVFVRALGLDLKITVQTGSEIFGNKEIKNFEAIEKIILSLGKLDYENDFPKEIPFELDGIAYWIFNQIGAGCLAVCVEDEANGNEAVFVYEPEDY